MLCMGQRGKIRSFIIVISNRIALAIAALALVYTTPAAASIDPVADFFDSVFQQDVSPQYNTYGYQRNKRRLVTRPIGSNVSEMIAEHVSSRIGSEWVPTALQIAKIESGGNCGAVNRSGATGIFQVMHPERFGISRAAARSCNGGISAGVSHMAACIAKGARTHEQMMRCHNSGSPFGRVERAYRRYV